MSDPRAVQAREAHRLAGLSEDVAGRHREQRDRLVRQLRAEDVDRWTYPSLAAAVGCSQALIAAIVKGRTGRREHTAPALESRPCPRTSGHLGHDWPTVEPQWDCPGRDASGAFRR